MFLLHLDITVRVFPYFYIPYNFAENWKVEIEVTSTFTFFNYVTFRVQAHTRNKVT